MSTIHSALASPLPSKPLDVILDGVIPIVADSGRQAGVNRSPGDTAWIPGRVERFACLLTLSALGSSLGGCRGALSASDGTEDGGDRGTLENGSQSLPSVVWNAEATLLASGQAAPGAVAVDTTSVYWFNLGTRTSSGKASAGWVDGQVMECAIGGCQNSPVVMVSGRRQPDSRPPVAFGTNGSDLLWSDAGTVPVGSVVPADAGEASGGLLICSVGGCGGKPSSVASMRAKGLALDQNGIYWTNFTANVFFCALPTCASPPSTLWSAGNIPSANGVAVDATSVYWSTPTQIMKCPKVGCGDAPEVLVPAEAGIPAMGLIALDETNVYFADSNAGGQGQILACSKAGCEGRPMLLAAGLDAPSALATDGHDVYWTESTTVAGGSAGTVGLVRRCSTEGCGGSPTTVAFGFNLPVAIAVDDRYVYVADQGTGVADGQIWRATK